MKHLKRVGILLAIFVIAFILIRVIPAPAELEPYGFYRTVNNEDEWASQSMQYVDPALCDDCHKDKHDIWEKSKHSTVSCENCHGPGQAHIERNADLPTDTSRESCGLCHAELEARPDNFPQINPEEHGQELSCITCHNPHDPAAKSTSDSPQIPHSLKDRESCLSCHDTEGLKPFPENHKGRSQDSCLNCHKSQ